MLVNSFMAQYFEDMPVNFVSGVLFSMLNTASVCEMKAN